MSNNGSEYKAGGAKGYKWLRGALGGVLGIVAGIGILALTIFAMGGDFGLGANFVLAQSASRGVVLEGWDHWIGIAFSVGTSGFIYALWERIRSPQGGSKITLIAACIVSLADAVGDVSGFYELYKGTGSVDYILPSNLDGMDIFFGFVVFIISIAHEPLLEIILRRAKSKNARKKKNGLGDWFEAGFVVLAGWAYHGIKFTSIAASVAVMYAFDIFLTPEQADERFSDATWWVFLVFSAVLFCIQIALVAWYVNVRQTEGMRGYKAIKSALAKTREVKLALGLSLIIVFLILLDTGFDLYGYNSTVYGEATLIPTNATPSWWLGALILCMMCGANEIMIRDIIRSSADDDEDSAPAGPPRPVGSPMGNSGGFQFDQ